MRRPPEWTEFAKFPATAGTIFFAIVVTGAFWLKFDISRLMEDPHIGRGELWRVVTCALPHGSIIHLAFNVAWVWTFGTYIERAFGSGWTLAIFVFLAAGSGAAEYAVLDGGIGLSGVGYGLFGMLWVLNRRSERFADAMHPRVVRLFVGWFFLCILLTVTKIMPIANIAHGMGAVMGAAIGWAITARRHRAALTAAVAGFFLTITLASATIARRLVNLSPYAGEDEARLGYEALKQNDNSSAARWFTESVRLSSKQPHSWYDLAVAQQRLKQYPEAMRSYERAWKLAPEDEHFRSAYEQMRDWLNQSGSTDHLPPATRPAASSSV